MDNKKPNPQIENSTEVASKSTPDLSVKTPEPLNQTTKTSGFEVPKMEEFTYQKKPGYNFKKIGKVFAFIFSLLVVILPLVYVALRYYPFKKVKPQNKGEIIWWNLGGNEQILEELIDEYTQKNPGVKITLQMQSEVDYGERLINSLKDGEGPDIFTIHNSWVPMLVKYLDFLPTSVYKEEDYINDFYPVVTKDFRTSGGIVAIPYEYDAITLYINDEIFARSGKVYPKTWDEFISLAKSLTIKDKGNLILQSGVPLGLTENVDYWQDVVALLMLQNKSNLFSPETTGQQSVEAMKTFSNFFAALKLWDNTLPASTIAFSEGKAAMFFGPGRARLEIDKLNPDLKYRTIIIPQVRKDDPSEPDVAYATYWAQSVSKNSGNKELAWDLLKFMASDQTYSEMLTYSKQFAVDILASPKLSMREKLTDDRYLGSIVALAPAASSWYLADRTYDGEEGINNVVNLAYKKVIDLMSNQKVGKDQNVLLKPLASDIRKKLAVFQITH